MILEVVMNNTLLAFKNKLCYMNYSGAINPPIFSGWNWVTVMSQQFIRSAFLCYLLTVLVPPIFINNNYLLLLKNNLTNHPNNKKENYEH